MHVYRGHTLWSWWCWRGRICVAVANASPPKAHSCEVHQQSGSCRNLATKDVVQFTGAGIPGHQRGGCGWHLSIVTNCRWPIFNGYGSSSQCWAPPAWFLRATPVASNGKASWRCSEWSRSILTLHRMHHLHYPCVRHLKMCTPPLHARTWCWLAVRGCHHWKYEHKLLEWLQRNSRLGSCHGLGQANLAWDATALWL